MFDIPHPDFKITVFTWNEKYLIEFEAGPLKQTYKLPIDKVNGEEQLKLLLDKEFLDQCSANFNAMFKSFKGTIDRHL